jgi:hypothetical protein
MPKRAVRYGITSLPPATGPPDRLLALRRGHWAIENRLHRRKDAPAAKMRVSSMSGKDQPSWPCYAMRPSVCGTAPACGRSRHGSAPTVSTRKPPSRWSADRSPVAHKPYASLGSNAVAAYLIERVGEGIGAPLSLLTTCGRFVTESCLRAYWRTAVDELVGACLRLSLVRRVRLT